jgi:hypothetical protein
VEQAKEQLTSKTAEENEVKPYKTHANAGSQPIYWTEKLFLRLSEKEMQKKYFLYAERWFYFSLIL